MATVTTTSVTDPLIWPNNTLIDYSSFDGYWYVMVRASTANTFEVWRTNTGISWSLYVSLVRANVAEIGSIFISPMGFISWCYRTNESSEDRIYYRRLSLSNATWSAEVWLTATANGGVAGTVWGGLDVVTVDYGPSNSYQAGMVAAAQNNNGGIWVLGFNTLPGGAPQKNDNVMAGPRQFLPAVTTTGHHSPSIDVEHAGNGKTSGTPNLWVCYGRNGLFMNKLAWNGHGWINPAGKVDIVTGITARDYAPGRWDGTRFVMVRFTGGSTVTMHERNKSNTLTTTRTTPAHTAGVVRQATIGYNSTNGNPRIFAVGTSNNDLYYIDYDRGAGTWSSWTLFSATDITGANVNNFSVRAGSFGTSKIDVLTAHTGVDIVHTAMSLPFTPLTPTWEFTQVPYVDGSAADVNAALLLDWKFNDPDASDTQGSYAVRRQIGAGAFAYWRASDSTWQAAEVQNTSATTQLTLASGWGSNADANHSYAVKTWDASGLASPYSAALVLVPSVKVNPTIDIPVDLSTWPTDHVTITWTVAEQTAYRAVLCFFGVPLEGTDTGKVVSTATTHSFARLMENNFQFSVRLWTWNNEGLQSTMDENSFLVQFVPPRTPTITVSPDPVRGYNTIKVTNPPVATYIGAGTGAQGNNTTLNPALHASSFPGDLLLVMSAIENSGTGTPNTPSGYTSLATFGNVGLYGKIMVGGETAPSVSFTGGVAGAATSAQVATFREAALAALGLPFTQLNGSAQNIAYLGGTPPTANCINILIVWKQDGAATVTTTPAGFTKIGDIFNSNGQSTSWYYQIQTTATAVSSGTVTVTSGVAAISRSLLQPVSGVPLVMYNDIWRVPSGQFGGQIRVIEGVAVNGTGNDWRALSKQAYDYQAIAYGDNGSSAPGVGTA